MKLIYKYISNTPLKLIVILTGLIIPTVAFASGSGESFLGQLRIEFIIFGLILLGVALFHKQTFWVAVIGLSVLLTFKLFFDPGFNLLEHLFGNTSMRDQIMDKELRQGEWGIILNLAGLLLGFALLSKIFEESGVPDNIPNYLPGDWKGPFLLLVFICIISSFLDNIAAALIGGTIALVVFKNKVHIGFIAAMVAASNAGGAVVLSGTLQPQ